MDTREKPVSGEVARPTFRSRTGLGPAVVPVLVGLALLAVSFPSSFDAFSGHGRDVPRHLAFSRLEWIVNGTGMLLACALPLAWGTWSCRREGLRVPGVAAIVAGLAVCCCFSAMHLACARVASHGDRVMALTRAVMAENGRLLEQLWQEVDLERGVPEPRRIPPHDEVNVATARSESNENMASAWLALATGSLLFGLLLPTGGARPARVLRLRPPAGG